jgi:hypothetical protein
MRALQAPLLDLGPRTQYHRFAVGNYTRTIRQVFATFRREVVHLILGGVLHFRTDFSSDRNGRSLACEGKLLDKQLNDGK